jgi:hypothetical protein
MDLVREYTVQGVYDNYGLDRSFGGKQCRDELNVYYKIFVILMFLPMNYYIYFTFQEKKTGESSTNLKMKKSHQVNVLDYSNPITGRFSEPRGSIDFLLN